MSQKPRTPDQRSVTVGTKSASALWADFFAKESLRGEESLRAEGWIPLGDIAKQLSMSKPGADSLCARKIDAGEMERVEGRLTSGQRTMFYRPKVL